MNNNNKTNRKNEPTATVREQNAAAALAPEGLLEAGLVEEAQRFQRQTGDPAHWKHYARATFEAFAEAVPPLDGSPRLRWLQYPYSRLVTLLDLRTPGWTILTGCIKSPHAWPGGDYRPAVVIRTTGSR